MIYIYIYIYIYSQFYIHKVWHERVKYGLINNYCKCNSMLHFFKNISVTNEQGKLLTDILPSHKNNVGPNMKL
jgi:hypothetical protein